MDLGVGGAGVEVPERAPIVILLDTHALMWMEQRRPRTRRLLRGGRRVFISPASLLELQFLQEAGKVRLPFGALESIADDDRWVLDEPPPAAWFLRAVDLTWTRDPFDRLLAAHAQLRGWRLATADGALLERLGGGGSVEL